MNEKEQRIGFGIFFCILLMALTLYSLTIPIWNASVFYALFAIAFVGTLHELTQVP